MVLSIPLGNSKLGLVPSFSTLAHTTCPGASEFCRLTCYAQRYIRQYKQTASAYQRNTDARSDASFVEAMITTIGAKPEFRIHVSGDFDSPAYIDKWTQIVTRCPDTKFWAYTRSWRTPELLPALNQLRALPNMQLFASTDPTISEDTPDGWRVAYLETDTRYRGMECLEQNGKMPDCKSCGYCFIKPKGNVKFLIH